MDLAATTSHDTARPAVQSEPSTATGGPVPATRRRICLLLTALAFLAAVPDGSQTVSAAPPPQQQPHGWFIDVTFWYAPGKISTAGPFPTQEGARRAALLMRLRARQSGHWVQIHRIYQK